LEEEMDFLNFSQKNSALRLNMYNVSSNLFQNMFSGSAQNPKWRGCG
jgi:hypothetical protein